MFISVVSNCFPTDDGRTKYVHVSHAERREMIFDVSFKKFEEAYNKWNDGCMVQNAFPFLNADEREFILTGIYPDEWEEMFG